MFYMNKSEKMKRAMALLLSCALLLPCFGAAAFAEEETAAQDVMVQDVLEVEVDGSLLTFDDAKPFIENDRTLVPIRALCTALGIADENISYQDGAVSIQGMADGQECSIELLIGSAAAKVNGEEKTLDVAAQIIHDRTFVPLRFVSETFRCDVQFYGASPAYGNRRLISIKTPAYTKFVIYMPQTALDEGVDKLFQVAAVMTGVHQTEAVVGENDTPLERMDLMLAAGEPCIILDNGFVTDEKLAALTEQGLLAKLDELIEKYAPKTFEKIQADEELKKLVCAEDGSMIAFPVERGGKTERLMVSSAAKADKAVGLIHGYNELLKSLVEAESTETETQE